VKWNFRQTLLILSVSLVASIVPRRRGLRGGAIDDEGTSSPTRGSSCFDTNTHLTVRAKSSSSSKTSTIPMSPWKYTFSFWPVSAKPHLKQTFPTSAAVLAFLSVLYTSVTWVRKDTGRTFKFPQFHFKTLAIIHAIHTLIGQGEAEASLSSPSPSSSA
jgi:hypothetical protein